MIRISLFIFISLFTNFLLSQEVKNIHFEQDGKMINIYYDLVGSENELYVVVIYCNEEGQLRGSPPLIKVEGDVGRNVKAGQNKKITWDCLNEREKLVGDISFILKVTRKSTGDGYFDNIDEEILQMNFEYIEPAEFVKLREILNKVAVIGACNLKTFYDSHIKGAVNIRNEQLHKNNKIFNSYKSPQEFAELFGRSGINGKETIIIYDSKPLDTAKKIYFILKKMGASEVKLLIKDMNSWKNARIPLSRMRTATIVETFHIDLDN